MTLEEQFARASFINTIETLTSEQKTQVLIKLYDDCRNLHNLSKTLMADQVGMPHEMRRWEGDRT
jgi:hypothetical protein